MKRWMLWLVIAFQSIQVFALEGQSTTSAILIDKNFTSQNLGLALELLEDPTSKLTLEDIRSSKYNHKFEQTTKKNPSFGYTSSAYWARFNIDVQWDVQTMADAPLYLTLSYAQIDQIDLWCLDANGSVFTHQSAGDHVPLAQWPTGHREPAFEIATYAKTCYLRIKTTSTVQFPLSLSTQQVFEDMRYQDTAIQSLYFGALLVMMIYNALVALTTRSWAYGAYLLFLCSYGLFQCAFNGIGYKLLWPNASGWADRALLFFMAWIGITSCAFVTILLNFKKTAPRLYLLSKTFLAIYLVYMLFFWFLPYGTAIKIFISTFPFWAIFLIGSGIYFSARKVRVAQIYLIAWLMFIFGPLIIVAASQGWIPINHFTANASQIGSVIEFVLLSFALSDRIKNLQKTVLEAQEKVSQNLRAVEQQLELKVAKRTAELELANETNLQAYAIAEGARKKAETARFQAEQAKQKAEEAQLASIQTLHELQSSQKQLIQAEKMASLGLLVSNIAHELNSPIGAIHSSNLTIEDSLHGILENLPRLFTSLSRDKCVLFLKMVSHIRQNEKAYSTREERELYKRLSPYLEESGVQNSSQKARLLIRLRAHEYAQEYIPILTDPHSELIFRVSSNIAEVLIGANNIHISTLNVSRVLNSLKEFSGGERTLSMFKNPIHRSIEYALADLEDKLERVDVIRIYQDIEPVSCDPEALQKVWSYIIINSLYASKHQGILMIGIKARAGHVEIRIADFGCGIPKEIQHRIFEPFFTTRTAGEGGGMGLAIAKNIIEQHHGRIEVQSEVDVGSTFTVFLPYTT